MKTTSDFPSVMIGRRQKLVAELQSCGLRLTDPSVGASSRRGGAGPSDHKAVTVMGTTVMVPVHTQPSSNSPYWAKPLEYGPQAILYRGDERVGTLSFPPQPNFYSLSTKEGIPYWKIALLHGSDVLASTVLQHCVRYPDRATRCQFCAIGESLRGGRTIARKSPEQLAEVAEAARRLDGVTQVVLTTGTPPTPDRGAAVLRDCSEAITERAELPIQAQCEPPESFDWFAWLRAAGVVSVGMHLEVLDPEVRARIMPSKAELSVDDYFEAYREAVPVFGRGQVTTYLLAGLGDSKETLLEGCRKLIELGVYPFVVPFVPITGTPLEHHPPPSPELMVSILRPLGEMLRAAGMTSKEIRAGCGKCGACSSLSVFELEADHGSSRLSHLL